MAKITQIAGRNALGTFAPEFAHFNDDVLFGENWNNEDIDLKTRSIITVVALMAQGITDSSLKFHLQNAKDHGVTQKEIDAKLEEEQLKNARTITVEGRPVQDKDEVVLDFEGFVPVEFISMDGYNKNDENSFENPFVKPHNNPLPAIDDNTLTAEIKPFSWNVIRLKKSNR